MRAFIFFCFVYLNLEVCCQVSFDRVLGLVVWIGHSGTSKHATLEINVGQVSTRAKHLLEQQHQLHHF